MRSPYLFLLLLFCSHDVFAEEALVEVEENVPLRRHVRDTADLLTSLLRSDTLGPLLQPVVRSAISVFKVAAVAYVAYLVINFISPSLAQALLRQLTSGFLSASQSTSGIGQTLQNLRLSDSALDTLNIQGQDCRQRAACEVGQYVANNYPNVAQVMYIFSNYLPVDPNYSNSLSRGVGGNSCQNSCSYSPFQRIMGSSVSANSVSK